MTVLMPTGTYAAHLRPPEYDSHAMPFPGQPILVWTGLGRVRSNATGVDIALDPSAWPAVEIAPDDIIVHLTGPNVDGAIHTWTLSTSSLRKGLTADLDRLSYVQAFGERADW